MWAALLCLKRSERFSFFPGWKILCRFWRETICCVAPKLVPGTLAAGFRTFTPFAEGLGALASLGGGRHYMNVRFCAISSSITSITHFQEWPYHSRLLCWLEEVWCKWSAYSTQSSFTEFGGNRISSCVIAANSFCCSCFSSNPWADPKCYKSDSLLCFM